MRFSTLFSAAAGLISLAIATPIELGAQTFVSPASLQPTGMSRQSDQTHQSCDGTGLHAWPNNHGQATVGGTKQNIDHLDKVKTCKIPARGVLRIACAGGSAIYIRNFEVSWPFPRL
jgi:hypothetical protein